jgi:hypothetical protein
MKCFNASITTLIKVTLCIFFISLFCVYIPAIFISYLFHKPIQYVDVCYLQYGNDQIPLGVYGYKLLNSKQPKIFVLGASGVMHGFRPPEIEKEFPGYQVANLAVSGTNISGIHQEIKAIKNTFPRDVLDKSIFVAGIFFGTFIENRVRYGRFRPDKKNDPDINLQLKRWGFFYEKNGEISPKYTSALMWSILEKIERPIRVFQIVLNPDIESILNSMPRNLTLFNHVLQKIMGKRTKQNIQDEAIKFWLKFMDRPEGDLASEQFEELLRLKETVQKNNLKLIIVDLPITKWHQVGSPLFTYYQKEMRSYLEKITCSANIVYVSLQDLNDPSYFIDSVHVRPEYTFLWAKNLKKKVEITSIPFKK